jgi:hypothetical protein
MTQRKAGNFVCIWHPEISGLEVRVRRFTKRFTFHRFGRPPGVAADSELRTSENKTLATSSARIPLRGGDAVSVQVRRHLEIRLSPC